MWERNPLRVQGVVRERNVREEEEKKASFWSLEVKFIKTMR